MRFDATRFRRIMESVSFLYFLADTFINAFGITQPSEKARKKAAFFILALMILTLAGATAAFFVLHKVIK